MNWALRRLDGSLYVFQACGPTIARTCSIVSSRDSGGHTTYYRRDASGRLLKMDNDGDRWIAFEYDGQNRIARAYASTSREVRYEYDVRGRLSRAWSSDGIVHRYTHTDLDELATIEEPGASIDHRYEQGRVVRQVNRYTNGREPYTFDFTYHLAGDAVVGTDTKESDGSWSQYTWDTRHYSTSETRGHRDFQPAVFTYERDPQTKVVTALTLTCPDRSGRPLRHSSVVRPDNEEWIKWDLLQTHCSWHTRRTRRPSSPK